MLRCIKGSGSGRALSTGAGSRRRLWRQTSNVHALLRKLTRGAGPTAADIRLRMGRERRKAHVSGPLQHRPRAPPRRLQDQLPMRAVDQGHRLDLTPQSGGTGRAQCACFGSAMAQACPLA